MSRTARTVTTVTAVVAFALLFSACTGPVPDPDPSPTPSPMPSATGAARPTPSATPGPGVEPVVGPGDRVASVTALVARTEALELVDADGAVVERLDYLGSAEDAVAVLTALLGSEPEVVTLPGGSHRFPGVRYTWDDVLTLVASEYPEERRAELAHPLYWPDLSVSFRAQRIRGIQLTTSAGAQVGDDWAAISAGIDPDLWTCSGLAVEYVDFPTAGHEWSNGRLGVGISNSRADFTDSDQITGVFAPLTVADGCA